MLASQRRAAILSKVEETGAVRVSDLVEQLGVSDMAAHLFVVYWGLASFFTPPLCIAVYVAIAISGARMWQTGWEAMRLGIAAFIIPFAFVLNPGLLLQGSSGTIVWAIATAFAGSVLVACGIRGFALGLLGPVRRVIVGLGGLLLIGPGVYPPLTGVVLAAAAMAPWPFRAVRTARS